MRKFKKIIPATLASVLAFATSGYMFFANSPKTTVAGELKSPYTIATLEKVQDGTGWNKDNAPQENVHTFITKANGYAVGDNTPTDGVVASNDVVEYNLNLAFTAAKARTINVKIASGDDNLLKIVQKGTFCSQTGTSNVSAKWHNPNDLTQGCDYRVATGASVSLSQSVFLKAADTLGTIKKSKPIVATVTRENEGSYQIQGDPITVVSAPAADIILDNGATIDPYGRERWEQVSKDNPITGYFNIRVMPIKYGKWSTLGASTLGVYSSPDRPLKIDVKEFPKGTQFSIDDENMGEAQNGVLTVTKTLSGDNHTLGYTIPASAYGYKCTQNGKKYDCVLTGSDTRSIKALSSNRNSVYYDAHIIADKRAFSANSDDAALNDGEGSEPGSNTSKNEPTSTPRKNTIDGYPYRNNSWSRAVIERIDPEYHEPCDKEHNNGISCFAYRKSLYKPYVTGKTIFDDESLSFDTPNPTTGATGSAGREIYMWENHYDNGNYSGNNTIAENTHLRTELYATVLDDYKTEGNCHNNDCSMSLSDTFNPSDQIYQGNLRVTFTRNNEKGEPVTTVMNPSEYQFQWTKDDPAAKGVKNVAVDKTMKWYDGEPKPSDFGKIHALRVHLTKSPFKKGDAITARYDVLPVRSAGRGTERVHTELDLGLLGSPADEHYSKNYNVTRPATPSASVENKLKLVSPSTNEATCDQDSSDPKKNTCTANSGDVAYYTIRPKYYNIAYTDSKMTPKITVNVTGAGLIDAKNLVPDQYDMQTVGKDGNVEKLVFTPKGNKTIIAQISEDMTGALPSVKWSATVGNKAIGDEKHTISAIAEFVYDISKDNSHKYKHNGVTSGGVGSTMSVNMSSVASTSVIAGNTMEVNQPLTFKYNIVARNVANSGDKMQTILRMPSNNDHDMVGKDNRQGQNPNCTYEAVINGKTETLVNKEQYPGIDCSWHEYDRGTSHFEGKYKLEKDLKSTIIGKNSTQNVTFKYAVGSENDKNVLDGKGYANWKTWEQLTEAEKADIKAILVTFDQKNAENIGGMTVNAAQGEITIVPTGVKNHYGNYNHSGDNYVLWPTPIFTADKSVKQYQSWGDFNRVSAGTMSGTLWWDDSNDGYKDSNERTIPDVKISLYRKADFNTLTGTVLNNAKPLQTMNTWTDDLIKGNKWAENSDYYHTNAYPDAKNLVKKAWKGGYKFIELNSGEYVAVVQRHNGAGKTDGNNVENHGVPTEIVKSEDYYGQNRTVANTYSYFGNSGCSNNVQPDDKTCQRIAKDHTSSVSVEAGKNTSKVDFGYYAPHPLISVKKQVTNKACDGNKCKIQFAVTIGNDGNTTIRSSETTKLVDTMSKQVENVKIYASRLQKGSAHVYTQGDHSLVLSNGKIYAWGYNRNGQVGKTSDNGQVDKEGKNNGSGVKPSKIALAGLNRCTMAAAGSYHSAAICDGKLYTWGNNEHGQLGNGTWDNDPTGKTVHSTPTAVELPNNATPVLVGAGDDYTVAVDDKGTLYTTQNNGDSKGHWVNMVFENAKVSTKMGSLSVYGRNIAYISANDGKAYYITHDGDNSISNPKSISSNNNAKFTQISAGYNHILALDENGQIYTEHAIMSNNGNKGDFAQTTLPTLKDSAEKFVSVAAGYMNSAAVDNKGRVYTWGLDLYGNLAKGKPAGGVAYGDGEKPNDNATYYVTNSSYITNNNYQKAKVDPDSKVTAPVSSNLDDNVAIIAPGANHALYATGSGEVKIAGWDAYSNGENYAKNKQNSTLDVYHIGETTAQSISSSTKLYGSDYIDSSNMTPVANVQEQPVKSKQGAELIKRTITLPYSLPSGNAMTIVFEGEISRNQAIKHSNGKDKDKYQTGADKYVVNQAWFTSPETPFENTPNMQEYAKKHGNALNEPNLPSISVNDWNTNTDSATIADNGDYTGGWDKNKDQFTAAHKQKESTKPRSGSDEINDITQTCRVGADFGGENEEHAYGAPFNKYRASTDSAKNAADKGNVHAEDMCDQVGVIVDGVAKGAVFGKITGYYWFDKDGKGKQPSSDEILKNKDSRLGQQIVSLWDDEGNKINEVKTDKNGVYTFTHVLIDDKCQYEDNGAVKSCDSKPYHLLFSSLEGTHWTKPEQGDRNADSDVNDDKKSEKYGSTISPIQWKGVKAASKEDELTKDHIDAGYVLDDIGSKFAKTGGNLLIILAAIIGVTILIVCATFAVKGEKEMEL